MVGNLVAYRQQPTPNLPPVHIQQPQQFNRSGVVQGVYGSTPQHQPYDSNGTHLGHRPTIFNFYRFGDVIYYQTNYSDKMIREDDLNKIISSEDTPVLDYLYGKWTNTSMLTELMGITSDMTYNQKLFKLARALHLEDVSEATSMEEILDKLQKRFVGFKASELIAKVEDLPNTVNY